MKDLKLEHSDVVFMYTPESPTIYEAYGATMSAWGGATTKAQVDSAVSVGVHPTGGMWCLTAGAENLHKDPLLMDAVVRDIQGQPIAVPWLHDHTFEGTPSYWGCSSHPAFRAHLREQVCNAVKGGTLGLHVDDHMSTAHPTLYEGGCYCDHCMALFREHLLVEGTRGMAEECGLIPKGAGDPDEHLREPWESFDYRETIRPLAPTREACIRMKERLPLYREYCDFHLSRAASNVRSLGALAGDITQKPMTLSANTGLPNLEHTAVVKFLTHMVGEVHHHAQKGTRDLLGAVRAYRMAEALGTPIASTAAGQDWDHCLEHRSEGLVSLWIALSYACGQRLMAPHRMWCYNEGLGTRWYHGPMDAYAPIYRFIRTHADLFDGMETRGPLSVKPWDMDGYPLDKASNRDRFKASLEEPGVFGSPIPITGGRHHWIFPRESRGRAVIHALNLDYRQDTDTFIPQGNVDLEITDPFHGKYARAAVHGVPTGETRHLPMIRTVEGKLRITLPVEDFWSIVELTDPAS